MSEPLSVSESTGASACSAASSSPWSTSVLTSRAAVQDAVHGRCGELGRGKRRAGVSLGGAQIAASEREPAAVGQADGEPAAVAGRPRLRDRGVEQRPQLRVPLGPEQRERRLREPRSRTKTMACRPSPGAALLSGRERAGCKARRRPRRARSLSTEMTRGHGQQLGRRRRMAGGMLAQRLAADGRPTARSRGHSSRGGRPRPRAGARGRGGRNRATPPRDREPRPPPRNAERG